MRLAVILLAASVAIACGGPLRPSGSNSNYQGQWSGSYRVTGCTWFPASPSYAPFCDGYALNTTFPLSITFSQNGEVISGQFIAGDLVSNAFVSVRNADGGLQIRSRTDVFPFAYDFTWQLLAPVEDRLGGTLHLTKTGSAGLVGGANIEGVIITLTR
jgi:hypothetical protein